MVAGDRTSKSIKNIIYGVGFYVVTLVLSFISNRVFMNRLGADLFGLNATVSSIIDILNIAELGIGVAMASSLYGPLANGDKRATTELIALQGWAYKWVATFILVVAGIVMLFFPMIFEGESVPLGYAYAACIVMLLGSMSTYFLNYKQIVLSANQQEYVVTAAYKLPTLIRLTLQILAIEFLNHGYVWWLVIQVLTQAMIVLMVRRAVKKHHPYVYDKVENPGALRHKYPEVVRKVGQLFVHRIADVALDRTSPIVIYAFTSLAAVAAYANYLLIKTGVEMLLGSLTSGLTGSVGNLVASADDKQKVGVFWTLNGGIVVLASVAAYGFYVFADCFVAAWVGPDLVLGGWPVVLLTAMLYIAVSRSTITLFTTAHGYFSDIWAPLTEAGLNLALSVLFGYFWGLTGVLMGVLTSLVVIVLGWKPYFLFRVKSGRSPWPYWLRYLRGVLVAVAVGVGVNYVVGLACGEAWRPDEVEMLPLLVRMAWQTALYGVVLLAVTYPMDEGLRVFVGKVVRVIRN